MFKYVKTILSCILFLCSCICTAQNKNQTDAAGLKQGYWEKLDTKTNKISYKGTFKDNKPQGIFYYYYPAMDSVRSKSEFKQDGKIAYVTMYHLKTGKIQAKGKYINEEKDSVWNFYDEKGILISTESYSFGKKNGVSKVFYENGVVSEEKNYKNNLLEGTFKQYFSDKKIKAEGTYFANEYNSKCSLYYPDGVAVAQGFYEKGVKKGVWLYKLENGKIKEKEVWQNGKLLNQKEMDAYFKSKKITFPEDTKIIPKTNNNTSPKK
jgi:antitoxin component YwqK of YwqJK toxin-antitoxin module